MTASGMPRILIIDDEPASIAVSAHALQPDHRIAYELSGPDALARLETRDLPDLVLLDVVMPDMDGFMVCRKLKADPRTHDLPVIIITSRDDPASEIAALESGANDFIPKPLNSQVVRLRVGLQLLLRQREKDLHQLNAELEQRVLERTGALSEALQRAETANRAKSAFLATMSHELRTPLNGMIGMTSIVQRKTTDPDNRRRLEAALTSANDLTRVLNNILEHARLEANLVLLEPREFSVKDLSERLLTTIGPMAVAKNLNLRIDLESLPPRLVGAFDQLSQILVQLLGNAVKFTKKGDIQLRSNVLDRTGYQLCVGFEVADTGVGIAPELQTRIFEPFEQADTSLTRQYGGAGLGLAIAQQLAQLMSGEVRLEVSDTTGSRFVAEVWLEECGGAETK